MQGFLLARQLVSGLTPIVNFSTDERKIKILFVRNTIVGAEEESHR